MKNLGDGGGGGRERGGEVREEISNWEKTNLNFELGGEVSGLRMNLAIRLFYGIRMYIS